MKANFFRIFLMSITLTAGFNLVAMDAEPEQKKQEQLQEEYTGPEPMEVSKTDRQEWEEVQDPSPVTLQSQDGVDMKVPIWVVKRSGTLNNLIEDAGIDDPLPVPNVNFKTFEMLIPLMREDAWMNAQREKDPLLYVPRKFQPFINQELQQKSINQVIELFKAANYLDIPFILNGVAAVIVDRIPVDAREDVLKALHLPATDEGRAETTQLLQKHNFDSITRMDRNLWQFIAKHLVHRTCGITQEYSVADYIAEHGQPRLHYNSLELDNKKLTSLFGMAMLWHREQINIILLNDNCFFDLSLDVQAAHDPFAHLANLEELYLEYNQLNKLPEQIFVHLANLADLYLGHNQLNNLPEQIFAHLANLERLGLEYNQLNNLPEQLFAHLLANLQDLYLGHNQLNNHDKQIIENALPNTRIKFN